MGLFSSIMKFALKEKSDEKEFYDVTSAVIKEFTHKDFDKICLKCAMDTILHPAKDSIRFMIYINDKRKVDNIQFNYKYENNNLYIVTDIDSKNVSGRMEIWVPRIATAIVNSKFSDISVKNINIDFLEIVTDYGDVNVSIKESNKVSISTISGDIVIKLYNNEFKIFANSENGDVNFDKISSIKGSKREIHCVSKDGDILIKSCNNKFGK